jgi:glutathione S-transferase
MMKLYYGPGACSFVPHAALEVIKAATGTDFETQSVKLHKGEQRTPEYLALNPLGLVPVLVEDGKPLTQIVAICDYLDRRFPAGRFAADRKLGTGAGLVHTGLDEQLRASHLHPRLQARKLRRGRGGPGRRAPTGGGQVPRAHGTHPVDDRPCLALAARRKAVLRRFLCAHLHALGRISPASIRRPCRRTRRMSSASRNRRRSPRPWPAKASSWIPTRQRDVVH